MQLDLEGKVALVTAGSKGMGRAIALALADEGVRVAITARGSQALESTAIEVRNRGAEVLAIPGDVSRSEDIETMVNQTVERFGAIDVLLVNAGGPPAKSFVDSSDEDWQQAVELTLLSAVRLIRAALPHLTRSRGSVVTIESISVKQPVRGLLLSNSIRPATIGLIKTLADELGAQGIRLNNILPGMIMTDRSLDLADSRARATGKTRDEIIAETAAGIPLGRYGTPEEIANLAVFLASNASSYITGASILCDGGLYRGLY
ncbi:MAG TPA: SDR family oxidoreductase [Chloroflexota bacterium]|jgi:3-oxoacyl-[acyl-carrier protein] reductase|nr:SDR family oxidoreductase [Chloroflexota bacterium]